VDRIPLFPVSSSVVLLDDRICVSPLKTLGVMALRCYDFRSLMLAVAFSQSNLRDFVVDVTASRVFTEIF
jgi:hypothetical protein